MDIPFLLPCYRSAISYGNLCPFGRYYVWRHYIIFQLFGKYYFCFTITVGK